MRIDGIFSVVCDQFQVDLPDLVGSRRLKGLVEARHIAMWLARATTDLSLDGIAKHFDNRHHTTILHAIDSITQRMKADPKLDERVRTLHRAVLAHRRAGEAPYE